MSIPTTEWVCRSCGAAYSDDELVLNVNNFMDCPSCEPDVFRLVELRLKIVE